MSLGFLPALLLVPPMNCLAAACLGAALGRRRFGATLRIAGLGSLVLLSLPAVSGRLLGVLEAGQAPARPAAVAPQAIVILSAGQDEIRDGDRTGFRPDALTLEREQAGAALARRTGLPVLVSGGTIHAWEPPLADTKARSLKDDFGVPVRWREAGSDDTWSNAIDSAALLRRDGVTSIYLVTHAWHMPRAVFAFRRAGLLVSPSPVAVDAPALRAAAFVPAAHAWQESYWSMHEMIGLAWYTIRH